MDTCRMCAEGRIPCENNGVYSGSSSMVQGLQNEDQAMKCMYCQDDMVRGNAPFYIDRKTVHLSLDDVAAWICTQCGEVYFEEAEVNAVQDIIRAVDERTGRLVRTA